MSDPDRTGGFDWASPRWRESEDAQAEVEQDRRYRDQTPPGQHGAIDGGESLAREEHDDPEPAADSPAEKPGAPHHSRKHRRQGPAT